MTPQQAPAASTPLPLPQGRTRSRLAAFAQAAARAAIPCCLAAAAAGFAEIAQANHFADNDQGQCTSSGGRSHDVLIPPNGSAGSGFICAEAENAPQSRYYSVINSPGRLPSDFFFNTGPLGTRFTDAGLENYPTCHDLHPACGNSNPFTCAKVTDFQVQYSSPPGGDLAAEDAESGRSV